MHINMIQFARLLPPLIQSYTIAHTPLMHTDHIQSHYIPTILPKYRQILAEIPLHMNLFDTCIKLCLIPNSCRCV